MYYTAKRTLEERHYDRLCDLFGAPSFKGVNLAKNNPLNLKRNDEIPVTGATFDDGTNITVTLRSDNTHYFFHTEVTGSAPNLRPDTAANPFRCAGSDEARCAEFSACDPDTKTWYIIKLLCVPDHLAMLTVNTASRAIPLYVGPVHQLPELTHEYLSQTIADKVMEHFNMKMDDMASFLANAGDIVLEERQTAADSSWVKRTEYGGDAASKCVATAVELIERHTKWNWFSLVGCSHGCSHECEV